MVGILMNRQDGDLKLTKAELTSAFNDPHWAGAFPPLLSVDQAARLLQVPKATVYNWSSRGLLKGCSRKVGKHLRLFRDRLVMKIFNHGLHSDD
jgi:excisionase family DNA binding protein